MSTFDTLRSEWAEKKGKMEQLHAKMDPNLVVNLVSTIEKLGGETESGISQVEFLLSMLVESGVLQQEEIGSLKTIFAKAGGDDEGKITKEALETSVAEMQTSLAVTVAAAEASGSFFTMPKMVKVAPEPEPMKVVTEDDLVLIETEVLSKLSGLKQVRCACCPFGSPCGCKCFALAQGMHRPWAVARLCVTLPRVVGWGWLGTPFECAC